MTKVFVQGIPIAKGSMKAFVNRYTGKPIIMRANDKQQDAWAAQIREAVSIHFSQGPSLSKSFGLFLSFRMPRPKHHYSSKGGITEKNAGLPHNVKPDIDKLIRLVLDALTGIAYMDDAHVTKITAEKVYVNEALGMKPGIALEIEER